MLGWIKMPLGKEIGFGPGHFVLDGDPAPHSSPSPLSAMPIVANQWPISETAELLLPYSHFACAETAIYEPPVKILTSAFDFLTPRSLWRTIFQRFQDIFCWFLHWISWM